MKILVHISKWIFVICIPLLLLSASIAVAVNSLSLYKYGFEKFKISAITGLDDTQLDIAARGLISYFNSGEEYIHVVVQKDGDPFVLFNEREVLHLKDVKDLFRLDYFILMGSAVYVLSYAAFNLLSRKNYLRRMASALAWGSGVTLGLMLALLLGTIFGFDSLFLEFHLISFSNDLWQLDPSRDYLLMLFPGGFWQDAAYFIALGAAITAAVIGLVSGGYLFFSRKALHSGS